MTFVSKKFLSSFKPDRLALLTRTHLCPNISPTRSTYETNIGRCWFCGRCFSFFFAIVLPVFSCSGSIVVRYPRCCKQHCRCMTRITSHARYHLVRSHSYRNFDRRSLVSRGQQAGEPPDASPRYDTQFAVAVDSAIVDPQFPYAVYRDASSTRSNDQRNDRGGSQSTSTQTPVRSVRRSNDRQRVLGLGVWPARQAGNLGRLLAKNPRSTQSRTL